MRTSSPVRLVTNSSRPYFPSSAERKAFGTLSRPLSSTRACSWPLNGQTASKDTTSLHNSPQRMVVEPQVEINRKSQHVSKLRKRSAQRRSIDAYATTHRLILDPIQDPIQDQILDLILERGGEGAGGGRPGANGARG